MNNARFWIYWNGTYSKVVLRPGEALTLHTSEATDEGWNARTDTYEYDADEQIVTRECYERGRDCDGLMEWNGEAYFKLGHSREVEHTFLDDDDREHAVLLPKWEAARYAQRDYTAEAAGY